MLAHRPWFSMYPAKARRYLELYWALVSFHPCLYDSLTDNCDFSHGSQGHPDPRSVPGINWLKYAATMNPGVFRRETFTIR